MHRKFSCGISNRNVTFLLEHGTYFIKKRKSYYSDYLLEKNNRSASDNYRVTFTKWTMNFEMEKKGIGSWSLIELKIGNIATTSRPMCPFPTSQLLDTYTLARFSVLFQNSTMKLTIPHASHMAFSMAPGSKCYMMDWQSFNSIDHISFDFRRTKLEITCLNS